MPRKQAHHAQLAHRQQELAAAKMRKRELEAALEAARAKIEGIGAEITRAYAHEDEDSAREHREQLGEAGAEAADLAHRVAGADQRVEIAQRELDGFTRDHARDLLAERVPALRERAARLTRTGHELVTAHRGYLADRAEVDQLVAAVPGALTRYDGPASAHEWEREVAALERAVREHPEVSPCLPRWVGLEQRKIHDRIAKRLKLRRRKRLTAAEQLELEQLERELDGTPRSWKGGDRWPRRIGPARQGRDIEASGSGASAAEATGRG